MCIWIGVQFLFVKVPICKVFSYVLTKTGSTAVQNPPLRSLSCFSPMNLLTIGRRYVHFCCWYVHFLIIPLEEKARALCPDLDFRSIVEDERDTAVPVHDCFFNHQSPDRIIPSIKHLRLLFQCSDKSGDLLIFSSVTVILPMVNCFCSSTEAL